MVAFIDSLGMKAFIVFFGFEFCNEMMEIHFIRKFAGNSLVGRVSLVATFLQLIILPTEALVFFFFSFF
jgi:hypothetical protein